MECTLHLECTWSGVGVYFYWWVIWPSPWSGILVYTYDIRSVVGVYTPVGVVTEWFGVYTPSWSVHSVRVRVTHKVTRTRNYCWYSFLLPILLCLIILVRNIFKRLYFINAFVSKDISKQFSACLVQHLSHPFHPTPQPTTHSGLSACLVICTVSNDRIAEMSLGARFIGYFFHESLCLVVLWYRWLIARKT